MVAVHLAGAVDGALIQRRPPQVVLAAGEFRRPGIMGCASVEWVVVAIAMDDCSLAGADRHHFALPAAAAGYEALP